jgi:hypothetical protein
MEFLIILALVFWAGTKGAATAAGRQVVASGRATGRAVAANGRAARTATAAAKTAAGNHVRTNGGAASRTLLVFATVIGGFARVVWALLRGVGRGVWRTGKAAVGGWREGWAEGKRKAAARGATDPAQPDPDPPRPVSLVDVNGGTAVGSCATCSHRYAEGRVAGCGCTNDRCPCRVAGTRSAGTNGAPVRKALITTNTEAQP